MMETLWVIMLVLAGVGVAPWFLGWLLVAWMYASMGVFLATLAVFAWVLDKLGMADHQWAGDTAIIAGNVIVAGMLASLVAVLLVAAWLLVGWLA